MIDCALNLDMKVEIHDCSTNYEFDVTLASLVIIDINVISAICFNLWEYFILRLCI